MNTSSGPALPRHEAFPMLVELATAVNDSKERIRSKYGIVWKSVQQIPPYTISVKEALEIVLAFGKDLKLLDDRERSSVPRGDSPLTDSIIDRFYKVLQKESSDLASFEDAAISGTARAATTTGGIRTAAASVGDRAAGKASASRKRSYSRVKKNVTAKKTPKGADKARVAASHSPRSRPSIIVSSLSSDHKYQQQQRQHQSSVAKGKEVMKWQIDKLVDWMKENSYKASPALSAMDDLVVSTGMKPSQIVAWAGELGGVVAKLLNTVDIHNHEVIAIDSHNDSVPDLEDEDDKVDGDHVMMMKPTDTTPCSVFPDIPRNGIVTETDPDLLEPLLSEFGCGFGDSDSLASNDAGRRGQKTSAVCESSTAFEAELFKELGTYLDINDSKSVDDYETFQRPSKRARSGSLDSLFALLD
jgi:hypothetical protein